MSRCDGRFYFVADLTTTFSLVPNYSLTHLPAQTATYPSHRAPTRPSPSHPAILLPSPIPPSPYTSHYRHPDPTRPCSPIHLPTTPSYHKPYPLPHPLAHRSPNAYSKMTLSARVFSWISWLCRSRRRRRRNWNALLLAFCNTCCNITLSLCRG